MSKRMLHLWIRAEQRTNEKRVGITPQDAAKLIYKGIKVTVEESADRIISTEEYHKVGCEIANQHSWPRAPKDDQGTSRKCQDPSKIEPSKPQDKFSAQVSCELPFEEFLA